MNEVWRFWVALDAEFDYIAHWSPHPIVERPSDMWLFKQLWNEFVFFPFFDLIDVVIRLLWSNLSDLTNPCGPQKDSKDRLATDPALVLRLS